MTRHRLSLIAIYKSKVGGLSSCRQVLVEPDDSLAEGLLLSPLLLGVLQISAHGEAVANAAEEVNLPRLGGLNESVLRLMAELSGEDLVDLC